MIEGQVPLIFSVPDSPVGVSVTYLNVQFLKMDCKKKAHHWILSRKKPVAPLSRLLLILLRFRSQVLTLQYCRPMSTHVGGGYSLHDHLLRK